MKSKSINLHISFILNNIFLFRYTLSTTDGFEVALIDYGATIQSIRQADKQNQTTEVTLGYDTLQGK
jgi:galactose mutarotase-like enzyme